MSISESAVWGKYPNYDDIARFEYGRRLWRAIDMRHRLIAHWTDPRHPYHLRFREQREIIEATLTSELGIADLDSLLRDRGHSLRTIAREIPPVFGSFF